jgi:glycosyltransferase involved in cell wall biosynthesis
MNIAPDLNEEKIIVSYHGLDLKTKYISAEKSSTPPFKIVSVGSCLPCKGYDRLLGACKILHDKKIDFRLTIVGGGPLESELRQHAIVLNIDEFVEFAGFVKQEDMPAYYQNADCFVLAAVPEIHWGIPNVLVEAMACCLPVIMTELPAIPEVIKDNDAGFLLDNPMPDNLAPLLERLAESEELRSRMGEIGRKRVSEMFDIDKNASEVASHFHGKKTDE